VAEISRYSWLIVSYKIRPGLSYIAPFSEALAPPEIILNSRMELRQIESDESHIIQSIEGRLISLRNALHIASNQPKFVGTADGIGTLAQLVDNLGLRRIHHSEAPLPDAQAQIKVLTVGRRQVV